MKKNKNCLDLAKKIYDLFVGNKNNYIEWNGTWIRRFSPLTPSVIIQHLKHKKAVGSYSIYTENNRTYSKWICIDIDSHKRVPREFREKIKKEFPEKWRPKIAWLKKKYKGMFDKEVKDKQRKFCNKLIKEYDKYLRVPKKSILYEDSGGGFHIWIFPQKTELETIGKYIEVIKPEIYKLYKTYLEDEEMPEFYPKQYKTDHLQEQLGNGVRIPLGKNLSKDYVTEILFGDIRNIELADITNIANEYEGNIEEACTFIKREELEEYPSQEISRNIEFWYYHPLIRPCFKRIMDGTTQCYNHHGHLIRMAYVHEMRKFNMPIPLIVESLSKQLDFDRVKATQQVKSVVKKGDWRWSCEKIKSLGYCHECNKEFDKYEPLPRPNNSSRLYSSGAYIYKRVT